MPLTKATYSMIQGAPINVLDYGADPTGVSNSTDAFNLAIAQINANSGGALIIPTGTYTVGKDALVVGSGWVATQLTEFFECDNPVVVEGNGAVIKYADGLHFGVFNTTTGAPVVTTTPYFGVGAADPGQCFKFSGCANVTIRNLEIDGNITNFVIGGQWGDTGWQLGHVGFSFYGCKQAVADNIYVHNFGVDGFIIEGRYYDGASWIQLDLETEQYPHEIRNIKSNYNGRQGCSWTGGNRVIMTNCEFAHTGKNGVVQSSPSAGIDIEPNSPEFCANGTFVNCYFYDNYGVGILTVGDVSNCTFVNCTSIGTTNSSLWNPGTYMKYLGCYFNGKIFYPGPISGSMEKTHSKFYGCRIAMVSADSPTTSIFGNYCDFSNSQYAYFDDCAFEADGSHQLPFSVGTTGITYNNCKFFQDSSAQCYTNGVFTGYTLFEFAGPYDATSNENYGRFVLNGTQLASTIPVTKAVNLVSYNGVISSVTRVANYVDGPTWAATVGGAVIGDVVFNANAASGGPAGWMCTAAGNPGTWKAMANLA